MQEEHGSETWEIHLGRGVGPIRIGMTPEEAAERMGEPTDVATEREGADTEELLWSYAGVGLTFVRKRRDGHELSYLHIDHPETTLGGTRVIGLGRDALFELVRRIGLGDPTSIVPNDAGWGFGRSKYSRGGDSTIYFWMQDGVVSTVQVQDSWA